MVSINQFFHDLELPLLRASTVHTHHYLHSSDIKQLIELIETLEEHEDIQKVYSNFDFDESEITSLL